MAIDQFTAAKTRLKKKDETRLTLAFRSEPEGEHIYWSLACSGVAITGWDAPQLLSVSERTDAGVIQAIDARDFIVNGQAVLVVVKRSKAPAANGQAQCTVTLSPSGTKSEERTVAFSISG